MERSGGGSFSAMDVEPNIEYFDMPASIRDQYQYHTEANMQKIKETGYTDDAMSLEEGVTDYVKNYLIPGNKRLGEAEQGDSEENPI